MEERYLRILFPWPTWYMPQEKTPKVVRNRAMALGPLLGIRRANRTGANPPGGGPSWRTGMSFTLAIPGFFLIIASVIFATQTTVLLLLILILLWRNRRECKCVCSCQTECCEAQIGFAAFWARFLELGQWPNIHLLLKVGPLETG